MSGAGAKSGRRRVFIVDDHPLVREWLASLVAHESDLEICGQAEDAATALAAVPLSKPDVVVVDLSLRQSSGLELLKDLRAHYPAMKLLVLSMHEEVSYAERAIRAGAQGYVVKRESGSQVVQAIRTVLRGEFFASATMMAQLAGRLFGNAARPAGSPEDLLSDREMEVFRLRGKGRVTKEIAEFLRVSVKTIESYDARIKQKLGIDSAGELMREAVRWNDRQDGV